MALRVLLADESSTIKKVIQLSLHDYGAEVKAVPVGIDVMSVAESFSPDIILIDVLLPKKSGYDVAKDFRESARFAKIPIVMMWSGFMDIDEAKLAAGKPDAKLEKPFDSETLRQIVQTLVPKTQSNPVSSYLQFPKLPEFKEEPKKQASNSVTAPPMPPPQAPSSSQGFTAEDITVPGISASEKPASSEDVWSQFDLPTTPIPVTEGSDFLNLPEVPEDEFTIKSIDSTDQFEEISFDTPDIPTPMPQAAPTPPMKPSAPPPIVNSTPHVASFDPNQMAENIIREEARIVIEKICWEILPGIAERVIKEEINKLLKETEKSI